MSQNSDKSVLNSMSDTQKNLQVFPKSGRDLQVKSIKDIQAKLNNIVNEQDFKKNLDLKEPNNFNIRLNTQSSCGDLDSNNLKTKKILKDSYSMPQIKRPYTLSMHENTSKYNISGIKIKQKMNARDRNKISVDYNERFKHILIPKNYRAIYESYQETRQANQSNFGVERTPYFKKFVKKPVIDKIQNDRSQGKRNIFKEQLLVDSINNRVRDDFEPQGSMSPRKNNIMFKIPKHLESQLSDYMQENKIEPEDAYKHFNRGFTMLNKSPIMFDTQIDTATASERITDLMASKNRYVKNSEMGLQQQRLNSEEENKGRLSMETIRKNFIDPSCLETTLPYLTNIRKCHRISKPIRISNHFLELFEKANEIPAKRKWWASSIDGSMSRIESSKMSSANISMHLQDRASALHKIPEISFAKNGSYLMDKKSTFSPKGFSPKISKNQIL